jgi:hypothetical protein
MARYTLDVTDEMLVHAFDDSMAYEIVYALGVPFYDVWDYSRWEYMNFTRATHARLLYDFFEGRGAKREANKESALVDDVICSDFLFPVQGGLLDQGCRDSLNRRLIHFSYSRVKVDPNNRAWDDRILGNLLDPVIRFMKHILGREEFVASNSKRCLFRDQARLDEWNEIISILTSGRELVHWSWLDSEGVLRRMCCSGRLLPNGKPQFTRLVRQTTPPDVDQIVRQMRSYTSAFVQ